MKYMLILFCITVMPGCQFIQGIIEPATAKYRIGVKSDGKVTFGMAGTKFLGVETEGKAVAFVKEKDGKVIFEKNVTEGTKKAWKRDGKEFNEIDWETFLAEWSPLPW